MKIRMKVNQKMLTVKNPKDKKHSQIDPRMLEPLVTDRPDATESTETIPPGHFQLEAGYTFTYDREGDERNKSQTFPEILLRAGISENFELRLAWEGYNINDNLNRIERRNLPDRTVENTTQGATDLSLGFKWKFYEQDGLIPHMGIIGEISLPSGSAGLSSGDVDPAIAYLWAYDIDEKWSVGGNVKIASNSIDNERIEVITNTLSVGYSISDQWAAYLEYFGDYPLEADMQDDHYINGGFTYLINNDLQFDVRAGGGLNDEADDFFAGVGLSWRF